MAVSAGGRYTVGLRSDGTVVAVGDNRDGQCNVFGWRLFNRLEELEYRCEERAALQEELVGLNGLFAGRRRREIETQLMRIDEELQTLK